MLVDLVREHRESARDQTERSVGMGARAAPDDLRCESIEVPFRRNPGAEVSANEHRSRRLREPAAEVDERTERRAERDLDDSGPADGAAHGREDRARLLLEPDLTEPAGAVAGDECQVRERLDVLDECRAPIDAALERTGRLAGRLGLAAAQPSDGVR